MIKTRFGYTVLLHLLLPRVIWHLLWRARKQPAYLRRIPERFGFYSRAPDKPVIWVHAVSVGETRAAQPLIAALEARYPGHRILLTHMTPTGMETGGALFGDRVLSCYLPYDYPGAVARFLRHFRPQLGIVIETEIWANLIHACRERGAPLYLVNARLSEKSFNRYRRFAELVRASLGELTAIAAQTADDARRLASLGAGNITVTGNLKFDIVPPPDQIALGRAWRERYGAGRPVLLAASTRDGEEALLLDVLDSITIARLLTVIVPRHPQRFDEVAALIERRGVAFQRRSADEPVSAATRIVLGDSMGEMFAYYAACDVAFIGGSLLPFGAQNLIEACAAGVPVVIGPSTFNFAEAAALATAAGAARRVQDAAGLAREVTKLIGDATRLREMGEAATAFARTHQGATERVMALLRVGEA
jgi:3-deoxy-D-manno-octulosonic-acid transferase